MHVETPGGVLYLPHGPNEELLPEGERLAQDYPVSKWKSKALNLFGF